MRHVAKCLESFSSVAEQNKKIPLKAGSSLLGALALALLASSSASAADCNTRCQNLKTDFRFAVTTSNQIYCYFAEKKAETRQDFNQLAKTLEDSISSDTTDVEYFHLLRRWAGSFHDGHVNLLPSSRGPVVTLPTSDYRFEVINAGLANEKLLLAVAPLADQSLIGSEVLEFNGQSAKLALDAAEPFGNGSTKRMRRQSAARRLVDTLVNPADITRGASLKLQLKNRQIQVKDIPLRMGQVSPPPASTPSTQSPVQVSKLAGNIGYLRIDGFGGLDSFGVLERAMDQIDGTDALLIDVRKNGGGDQSGDAVLARLTMKPITRYEISPRLSRMVMQARPDYQNMKAIPGTDFAEWSPLTVKPKLGVTGWAGKPVIVLTGNGCFSACDTFTSAIQANNLGEIAGEGTGGGTGTPHIFSLPISKHDFRYSVVRGRTFKGDFIEGKGTLPTLSIPVTIGERQSGDDLQLKKAIERVSQRLRALNPRHFGNGQTDIVIADLGTRQIERENPSELSTLPSGKNETVEELSILRAQK